jgi:hypothetical protein
MFLVKVNPRETHFSRKRFLMLHASDIYHFRRKMSLLARGGSAKVNCREELFLPRATSQFYLSDIGK